MKKLLLLLATMIFLANLFAQDRMFLRNGEQWDVKVITFSVKEITYKLHKESKNMIFTVNTSAVDKIIFKNGLVEEFFPVPGTEDFEHGDNIEVRLAPIILPYKHIVEVEGLSLFFGSMGINYEYIIRDGLGLEVKGGIIGVGKMPDRRNNYSYEYIDEYEGVVWKEIRSNEVGTPKGFFLKIGPKLTFAKDQMYKGWYTGWYWKPEVIYARYWDKGVYKSMFYSVPPNEYRPNHDYTIEYKRNYNTLGGMVNIGYQTVLANRITLDAYIATGKVFYFDKSKRVGGEISTDENYYPYAYRDNFPYDEPESQYSHFRIGAVDFTGGMSIGILLK